MTVEGLVVVVTSVNESLRFTIKSHPLVFSIESDNNTLWLHRSLFISSSPFPVTSTIQKNSRQVVQKCEEL